jgi:hypothetical protein
MLTIEYILNSQRLLNQYQSEEPVYDHYLPPSDINKESETPIVFKRGLKIDPETGERYFDFLD